MTPAAFWPALWLQSPNITDALADLSVKTVLLVVGGLLLARMCADVPLAAREARLHLHPAIREALDALIKAVVLVFLVIRPFVFQAFYIPSASMLPLLQEGDRILVSKFVYPARPPQRQEVIVFRAPPQADIDEIDYIKRIVAAPGDTVEVAPTRILIDERVAMRLTSRDANGIARQSFRPSVSLGFTFNTETSALPDVEPHLGRVYTAGGDLRLYAYTEGDRLEAGAESVLGRSRIARPERRPRLAHGHSRSSYHEPGAAERLAAVTDQRQTPDGIPLHGRQHPEEYRRVSLTQDRAFRVGPNVLDSLDRLGYGCGAEHAADGHPVRGVARASLRSCTLGVDERPLVGSCCLLGPTPVPDVAPEGRPVPREALVMPCSLEHAPGDALLLQTLARGRPAGGAELGLRLQYRDDRS